MKARLVAGVDEVGRGPLVGPVVTAAVILPPAHGIVGLADSKRLSEARRQRLAEEIRAVAVSWSLGRAEAVEVDALNILYATMLAMQRAVAGLGIAPQRVLVDGNRCPSLPCECEAVIKGDASVAVISAASILAKVSRDAEMGELEARFPGYGFARHKGYPTREHRQALQELGPCREHRRSFAPVRRCLDSMGGENGAGR